MQIFLSKDSADILAKIDGIKRWRVQPPMVRGGRKGSKDESVMKGVKSKLRQPACKKKCKTKAPKVKKEKKSKTKHAKSRCNVEEKKAVDDFKPDDIRRSDDGRETIRAWLQDIYEIDLVTFPMSKLFDEEGRCRMKFDGAKKFQLPQLLEAAPMAIECMHLCRFRSRD